MSTKGALENIDRLIDQGVQYLAEESSEERTPADIEPWCLEIEDTLRRTLLKSSVLADAVTRQRTSSKAALSVREILGILRRARDHVLAIQKEDSSRGLDERIRFALNEHSYRSKGLLIQIGLVSATLIFGLLGVVRIGQDSVNLRDQMQMAASEVTRVAKEANGKINSLVTETRGRLSEEVGKAEELSRRLNEQTEKTENRLARVETEIDQKVSRARDSVLEAVRTKAILDIDNGLSQFVQGEISRIQGDVDEHILHLKNEAGPNVGEVLGATLTLSGELKNTVEALAVDASEIRSSVTEISHDVPELDRLVKTLKQNIEKLKTEESLEAIGKLAPLVKKAELALRWLWIAYTASAVALLVTILTVGWRLIRRPAKQKPSF